MKRFEISLEKAIGCLRNQGIAVGRPIVGPRGPVFNVAGVLLTESQILQLRETGNLDSWGIRAFPNKVEERDCSPTTSENS